MKAPYSKTRGFSLIELLVSMTIFITVMTIASGALLTLIDANQKAQNQKLVMSNLAFVLQSMTREIRTGTDWYCGVVRKRSGTDELYRRNSSNDPFPQRNNTNTIHPEPRDGFLWWQAVRDCDNDGFDIQNSGSPGRFFGFIESGDSLTSGLPSNRIFYFRDGDDNRIYRILGNDRRDGVPYTPDEVEITSLQFYVEGTDPYRPSVASTDLSQPRLIMVVEGYLDSPDTQVQAETAFTIQTTISQLSLDV